MQLTLHVCTRIYANGDCVREIRNDANVERWYEHNSTFRFGQALVVDGLTRWHGYLSDEEILQAKLQNPWAFRALDPHTETKETAPIGY